MYLSYLYKAPVRADELGVFARIDIPAGAPILEFRGDLFTRQTLKHNLSQVIQVGHNSFLGPSGDLDDYLNHSCAPNCRVEVVGNRAILYSLYVISADTELTFDYSTTSTDTPEQWLMPCQCGSYQCRQVISGYQSIPADVKERYLQQRLLPLFITDARFL